jgi:hypothetical protein
MVPYVTVYVCTPTYPLTCARTLSPAFSPHRPLLFLRYTNPYSCDKVFRLRTNQVLKLDGFARTERLCPFSLGVSSL